MTIQFYGIPNCDTVKKARRWLDVQGVEYDFHDYKKEGADAQRLASWSDTAGWEVLLNKRGTTYRKLSEEEKADIDRARAIDLMVQHPRLINHPAI